MNIVPTGLLLILPSTQIIKALAGLSDYMMIPPIFVCFVMNCKAIWSISLLSYWLKSMEDFNAHFFILWKTMLESVPPKHYFIFSSFIVKQTKSSYTVAVPYLFPFFLNVLYPKDSKEPKIISFLLGSSKTKLTFPDYII